MSDERKGRVQRPNIMDELRKILEQQNKEIERLKKEARELIPCAFCLGEGKESRVDGELLSDENNRPVPCRICHGTGKVRM